MDKSKIMDKNASTNKYNFKTKLANRLEIFANRTTAVGEPDLPGHLHYRHHLHHHRPHDRYPG